MRNLLLLIFPLISFVELLFAQGNKQTMTIENWNFSSQHLSSAQNCHLFSGNCEAKKGEISISCDKIFCMVSPTSREVTFIATGKMVTTKIGSKDHSVRLSRSKRLVYNSISRSFLISEGPPFMQVADKFVNIRNSDATIILREDGSYDVYDLGGRPHSHIRVIPKPKKLSIPGVINSEVHHDFLRSHSK